MNILKSFLSVLKASSRGTSGTRRRGRQSRIAAADVLELRVLPATWTGGAILNDKFSDPKNWLGEQVPLAGEDIIFPDETEIDVAATDRSVVNDLSSTRIFGSIRFRAGGYEISGNPIQLSGSISSATLASSPLSTSRINVIKADVQIAASSSNLLVKVHERDTLHLAGRISGPAGAGVSMEALVSGVFGGTVFMTGSRSNTYTGPTTVNGINLGVKKSAGTTTIPGDLKVILRRSSTPSEGARGNVFLHNSDQVNDSSNVTLMNGSTFQYLSPSVRETIGTLTFHGDESKFIGGGTLHLNGDVRFVDEPGTAPPTTTQSASIVMNSVRRNGKTNWRLEVGALRSLRIDAKLTGDMRVTKLGAGSFVTEGTSSNDYTGLTLVADGKMIASKPDGVQVIPGNLIVGTQGAPANSSTKARYTGSKSDQFSDSAIVTIHGDGSIHAFGGPTASDLFRELRVNGGEVRATTQIKPFIVRTSATDTGIRLNSISLHPPIFGVPVNVDVADGAAPVDVTMDLIPGIGGNGSWAKNGAGTLLIGAGNNNATQHILLNNGVLDLQGIRFGTTVEVRGGTLKSSAILAGLNAVFGSVQSEQASVSGDVTFGQDSRLILSVDQNEALTTRFSVTGDTTLGVPSSEDRFPTLDLRPETQLTIGTKVRILQRGVTRTLAGLFRSPDGAVLNEGSSFTVAGQSFTIHYNVPDSTGNFLFVEAVRNNPPAFVNRSFPGILNEGDTATLRGTITEPDSKDVFILNIDWGDGQKEVRRFLPGTNRDVELKHQYANDGEYTVSLDWRDQHGGGNSGQHVIRVRNVAPVFSDVAVTNRVSRSAVAGLFANVIDAGLFDRLTISADWGDGSSTKALTVDSSGRLRAQHVYQRSGRFLVKLTAGDGHATSEFRVWITIL